MATRGCPDLRLIHRYEHRGRLIDVMAAWLQLQDPRDLNDLQRHQFLDLRSFLRGVRVSVTVSPGMKPKAITDLVQRAALQEFDTETERLKVKVGRITRARRLYTDVLPSGPLRKEVQRAGHARAGCGGAPREVCDYTGRILQDCSGPAVQEEDSSPTPGRIFEVCNPETGPTSAGHTEGSRRQCT